ncbi:hypothetical protein J6590_093872 [Homalodisca vitripennis]|nr:hypothetical protein J6590_093872 [Homalodisca vitripennis]
MHQIADSSLKCKHRRDSQIQRRNLRNKLAIICSPAAYTQAFNFLALSAARPTRRVNISSDIVRLSLLLVHLVVLTSPLIPLGFDCSSAVDTRAFYFLALSAPRPTRRVNISSDTVRLSLLLVHLVVLTSPLIPLGFDCSSAVDTRAFYFLALSAARPSRRVNISSDTVRLSLLLVHLAVLTSLLIPLGFDCSPAVDTRAFYFLALSAARPSRRVNISSDTVRLSLLLVHLAVLTSLLIPLGFDCSPAVDTRAFYFLALSAPRSSRRVNISPDTLRAR